MGSSSSSVPYIASKHDELPDADKIRKAMLSCDPSKAPGYDVFNMKFIREMWIYIRGRH